MAAQSMKIQLKDMEQSTTCGVCLQLLSDPRGLTCGHTFCLQCLKGLQTTAVVKDCPMCRMETVPSKDSLDSLPVNKLAVEMVKLVHTYDPGSVEPAADWSNLRSSDNNPQNTTETSELFSSFQTMSLDAERNQRDHSAIPSAPDEDRPDIRANVPVVGTDTITWNSGAMQQPYNSLGGYTMVQPVGSGSSLYPHVLNPIAPAVTMIQSPMSYNMPPPPQHIGVICKSCHIESFHGNRYKCGICEDFDLCEICEAKPREKIHDTAHIFIKLKYPIISPPARRRVLNKDSTLIGKSQDFTQPRHILQREGKRDIHFSCNKCKVSPIIGTRFKCGECADYDLCEKCEQISSGFHDWRHVFLVLRHPVGLHTIIPQIRYQFYIQRQCHLGITCNHCRKHVNGDRYICGICKDYDLCMDCEGKPREEVHNVEHIFIKLHYPSNVPPPHRRVLAADSTKMGKTQDFTQTKHVLEVRKGKSPIYFQCNRCMKNPIIGTRYKCGICKDYDLCGNCEQHNQSFHDPGHVFLALRHPVGFHTTVPQLTYHYYR